MSKQDFLDTELGRLMIQTVSDMDKYCKLTAQAIKEGFPEKIIHEYLWKVGKSFAKWEVFDVLFKQVYGIAYQYKEIDGRAAVATDDLKDILWIQERSKP